MSSNNEKYQAILELIQPRAANVTREMANKIAASGLEKHLTMEKMLFMMKEPDEKIEDMVMMGMLQHYGVKDGKIVKASIAGNKLLDLISADKDGNYSIDLPKEELYRFRQMIIKVGTQVKGSIPNDDKMLISGDIYGYSLMFFKNWMVPLAKDKFGKLRYDPVMQEFEAGRMRIAGEQIASEKLQGIVTLLQEFAFLGGLKKINKDLAAKYLDRFIDETPEIRERLSKGEVTREQLLDQYHELRIQKLRGAVNDLRMVLGWLVVAMLAKAAIPDDEQAGFEKLFAQNMYMMANRGWLETSFFFSPKSANQLITQPFMLWGLVTDTQKLMNNTFDEYRDLFAGENSSQDKSPFMYYSMTKFIPFGKPVSQVFDIFDSFKTK